MLLLLFMLFYEVAHVATHAIVAARLITKGEDHGVHMFIVQLRSLEDHRPLPGLSICLSICLSLCLFVVCLSNCLSRQNTGCWTRKRPLCRNIVFLYVMSITSFCHQHGPAASILPNRSTVDGGSNCFTPPKPFLDCLAVCLSVCLSACLDIADYLHFHYI